MTAKRRSYSQSIRQWERRLSINDMSIARQGIDMINQTADRIEKIPRQTRGNHMTGHNLHKHLLKILRLTLEKPMSSQKTLIEELGSSSDSLLNNHVYRVLKNPGGGLSRVALVEVIRWGRLPEVKALIGRRAIESDHPLFSGHLLQDGTRYYLNSPEDDVDLPLWDRYGLGLELGRLILSGHYTLEYLGLFQLAIAARKLDMRHILELLSMWVLLEWSDAWRQKTSPMHFRYSRDEDGNLTQRALGMLATEYPCSMVPEVSWHPPRGFITRVTEQIAGMLEPAMTCLRQVHDRQGGALPQRSAGGLILAGDIRFLPFDILKQMQAVDKKIRHEVPIIGHMLEQSLKTDRFFPKKYTSGRRPISPADLLVAEPVRNLAAMKLIQGYWMPFLADFTEDSPDSLPGAPMPRPGLLPLEVRLGASATAVILALMLDGHAMPLPDSVFPSGGVAGTENEDENKAMFNLIKINFHNYLGFRHMLDKLAGTHSVTPDHWLTLMETAFVYDGGSGVDTVLSLVTPAFFFSDSKFASLIRYEAPDFKKIWRSIRSEIEMLHTYHARKKYYELNGAFTRIYRLICKLNLKTVEGIDPDSDEKVPPALRPPQTDPFAAPDNIFSKDTLLIEESGAPILLERLGGGNPMMLHNKINSLKHLIGRIKKLYARPQIPAPRIKGRAHKGISFDMQRAHALMVGDLELPFESIDYRSTTSLDTRYTVRILMDFSGSMNCDRVEVVKDCALVTSLGLESNFDVVLYFYTTKDSFYAITEVFDSRRRRQGGLSALATITDPRYRSGWGWNPDAAALLGIHQMIQKESGFAGKNNVVILLGDMEFCSSLKNGLESAEAEVGYACNKLIRNGHHIILGRCGNDEEDPIPQTEMPHGYFHLPETGIDLMTTTRLCHLIQAAITVV
jgi:hypothetical protein